MASKDRYVVVRVYKNSNKKKILARGLKLEQAQRKVNEFQEEKNSMVVFYKEYNFFDMGSW